MYIMLREKGRDLTQSYDKSPYTHWKSKNQRDNTKTPPKTPITQRLQTDLRRSVGVTIATPLVWLDSFQGHRPFHSPQLQRNQTDMARQKYCLQYRQTFYKNWYILLNLIKYQYF